MDSLISSTRGLLPRLGQFVSHEAQVPYDYDQLISLIAPRPAYIVSPQMDRGASPGEVSRPAADAVESR